MIFAMNYVSEQLIDESMNGSPTIKSRVRAKFAATVCAAAAACAALLLFFIPNARLFFPASHPSETSRGGELSVTAFIDGNPFVITRTENADGTITGMKVTPPKGYEVLNADEEGGLYGGMIFCIVNGETQFYVACDVRTGDVTDFVRPALREYDGAVTVLWHSADSAVLYLAVAADAAVDNTENASLRRELCELWRYDRSTGELCEWSPLSEGRTYVVTVPRSGSPDSTEPGYYGVVLGEDQPIDIAQLFPGTDAEAEYIATLNGSMLDVTFEQDPPSMHRQVNLTYGGIVSYSGDNERVTSAAVSGTEISVGWRADANGFVSEIHEESASAYDENGDELYCIKGYVYRSGNDETVTSVFVRIRGGDSAVVIELATGRVTTVDRAVFNILRHVGISPEADTWEVTLNEALNKLIISDSAKFTDPEEVSNGLYYADIEKYDSGEIGWLRILSKDPKTEARRLKYLQSAHYMLVSGRFAVGDSVVVTLEFFTSANGWISGANPVAAEAFTLDIP